MFNFEGGCYAKCIRLSARASRRSTARSATARCWRTWCWTTYTRRPDYDDVRLHGEHPRRLPAGLHPGNAVFPSVGGHPKTIMFLTADAFGVLPPISRLTTEQAMYHFLSGYTSKLAGTERGVTAPEATFSTCFGAPFMPLPPARYARAAGRALDEHGAQCYLVNTGWSGGPYGVGKRMDLALTRAMVRAALSGALADVPVTTDPIFGLHVPVECPGVPLAPALAPRHLAGPGGV